MPWAEDNKARPAVIPARKPPARIPSSVVPWLTTRCLVAAVALQVLGAFVGSSMGSLGGVLFVLGFALSAFGLAAFAQVKRGSIGWVLAAVLPVVGPVIGFAVLRRRSQAPDAAVNDPVRAVRGAVHAVLFGALFWASYTWLHDGQIREVRGEAPDDFPVVAFVRAQSGAGHSAFLVQKRNFTKFAREYPEFSYLVSPGTENSLNAGLRYYGASGEISDFSPPGYFKVTSLSAGRQEVEVRYPRDEDHVTGWYEATAQGIEPKRYHNFHSLSIALFGMFALGFTLVIFLPIAWLLNRYFWPRWHSAEKEGVA
jgi:hypothetical protein